MKSAPQESVQCAIRLRTAISSLSRSLRAQDRYRDLNLAGLSVLGLLYNQGAMTATELARSEGVKPQTLTRLLTGLKAEGLIARQPDPADRRLSRLSLTRCGVSQLKHYANHRENLLTSALDNHLSVPERQVLLHASELMSRLATLLAELPPQAGKPAPICLKETQPHV